MHSRFNQLIVSVLEKNLIGTMKFLFLLMSLLTMSQNSIAQTPVSVVIGPVGGPNSYFYGPIVRASAGSILNYSRHTYLYTAAELGIPSGAKIIKLEWLKANISTVTGNNTFKMWIGNTTATALPTSSTWGNLLTGTTQVFNSTTFAVTGGSNTYIGGQFNIAGSDSFAYTGSNLQIMTDWIKVGTASGTVNFYTPSTPGKSIGLANNVAFTDAAILSTTTYGNSRPTIRITYVPVPPCTGIPFTGPIVSSVPDACSGVNFTLNITNSLAGSGITYLWQRSDNAAFTLNVSNMGTGASLTTNQTQAKYYRCIATCATGPNSDTSAPFLMNMSAGYVCACISTALSDADEDIYNFSFAANSNSSTCNTTAPGAGSMPGLYSNYQGLTPATVAKGSVVPFSISIGTCLGILPNVSAIFIDYNQNGLYSDAGELVYATSSPITGPHTETGNINIPSTALSGVTGMRVICSEQNNPITNPCGVYSWGETEDYTVNIIPSAACTGTPNPGNTVANPASICPGQNTILSLQNWTPTSGIQYQWYNSTGVISGATSSIYVSPNLLNSETYYCRVICNNSSMFSNSTPITITMNNFTNCYCQSRAGVSADDDIYQVVFNGATNTSTCTVPATGTGSILNRYANYHPLGNFTTIEQGATASFSIQVDDCDQSPYYSFGTAIWIDFNQNGSFADAGEKVFVEANPLNGPRYVTGNITIPCGAMTGQTGMRITEAAGYAGSILTPCLAYASGETEDYLINIIPKVANIIYNFGPSTASTANPTSGVPVANVTVSAIGQGNNANTAQTTLLMNATNPSNYTDASAASNAGITARNRNLQLSDTSAYFSFTLTPGSGFQAILDSIYLGSRSEATGPTTLSIRTSKDNYATSIANITVPANGTWNYYLPTMLPVVSSTPLTVRIYGYVVGGNGSITTGNTTVNWRVDDIKLKGRVTCILPCNMSLSATKTIILCNGGTSTITANALNGTGTITYSLNGGAAQLSNVFQNVSAGNYTIVATDANACTASTVVTINAPAIVSTNIIATACNAYTWVITNQVFTTSGIYTSSGITPSGCVRFDTLVLTINYNSSSAPITVTACDSYTWNGISYTSSGTYTHTSLNASGCTHTATLNLTIIQGSFSSSASSCDTYTWSVNNQTYNTSGVYTHQIGCQVYTLNLTIIPSSTSTTTISACDAYTWQLNGVTYTNSGTYTYSAGCGTSILILTITPTGSSSQTISACESYTWAVNNTTYTNSGNYAVVANCHTYNLILTILAPSSNTQSITACDNYTWSINNTNYTTSGVYIANSFCHTDTLVLNIIPSSSSTQTEIACDNYTWSLNNLVYTNSGIYAITNGCHTNYLNLTISQSSNSTSSITSCDSYTWSINGITYTQSGTYTSTSLNAAGCLHTHNLVLNITNSTSSVQNTTACNNYTWPVNGLNYTTSGTYVSTSLNAAGCLHTSTLNLTINYSTTSNITIVACDNYTWATNGITYTNSGNYTFTSINANGCLHTATLQLSIFQSSTSTQTISACDTYTWGVNGQAYTMSGTYTSTSLNAQGCTHTSILQLTIIPSTSNTNNVSACGSYTWNVNSITYTASGVYTFVSGCFTQILNLSITPITSSSQTISSCASYTWSVNAITYTNSGIYTHVNGCHTSTLVLTIIPITKTVQSISNCDSYTWSANNISYTNSGNYAHVNGCHTDSLYLTITPSTSSSQTESACGSFTWLLNNVTYTTTGNYIHVNGCHTTTLNLTITPGTTSTQTFTACDSYTWPLNNVTYTSSGTYFYNAACVVNVLNLTITPSTSSTQTVSVCDSYTWSVNNVSYTNSGIYSVQNGCHTNILNLTITQSNSSTQNESACGSYTWLINNTTYTNSGTYSVTNACFTNILVLNIIPLTFDTLTISVCDSYTWTLNGNTYTNSGTYLHTNNCHTSVLLLTITNSTTSTQNVTACANYTWPLNGTSYTASGQYSYVSNCHTTLLNLTINPNSNSTQTVTACNSYTWPVNNMLFTSSGTYTHVVGCHTYILQLTIIGGTISTQTITACDQYLWLANNTNYTASGNYTFISGCDTSVLALTIIPSTFSNTTISACGSYLWNENGITYTTSGVYNYTNACYSAVLNLTIIPNTNSTETATACDSYTWLLNNVTYSNSGNYTFVTGCHTTTLQLTITPNSNSSVSITTCDSYTWGLNNTTYTSSGTYTFINGCHTTTLILTIIPSTTSNQTVSACDSYTWPVNNITYSNSGTYTAVIACHTYQLTLTIIPSTSTTLSVSVCGSYTWVANNTTYTSTGVYSITNNCHTEILNLTITPTTNTTQNVNACNNYTWALNGITYTASGTYSIVNACNTSTLHLSILPGSSSMQSASACNSYYWSANNQTYTSSGLYNFISGCDTFILNVSIIQSPTVHDTVNASNTYTWQVNNVTYNTSGVYTYSVNNASGCDSLYVLHLSIIPFTIFIDQEISCAGFNDGAIQVYTSASGTWMYNVDGGTFNNTTGYFNGLAPGTHTFCASNGSAVYCDTFQLIEPLPLTAYLVIDSVVSCNGNDGALSLMAAGGTNILQGYITFWTNAAGDTVNDVINDNFALYLQNLPADTYSVLLEDDNGCFTTTNIVLPYSQPIQINASYPPFACGTSTPLNIVATGGAPYDTLTLLVNGNAPLANYVAGTYTITAVDIEGCSASTSITLSASVQGATTTLTECSSYTWVNGSGLTYTSSGIYTHTLLSGGGCDTILTLNLTISPCASMLSLHVLLQGFYDGSGMMKPVLLNQGMSNSSIVTDSIEVFLFESFAPYAQVAYVKTELFTDGSANCIFGALNGNYYIAIKHRNSLTTWSANPVNISSIPAAYNFTTAANKAYGDNLIELETGIFGLFTGDLNDDENVDLLDVSILETSVQNFDFGYINTDINGDGNTDLLDGSPLEINASNFIYAIKP
ncbi:MAG: hypothetical protein IPI46_01320 [Bacteroidetes bacterium]|nr:hypothetical protein [Bacteroidota bacterium]